MLSSENQNTEYKRTWSDEYLKWICGFANAQGGRIYIGVADDRTVIGLTDTELHRLSEDIPNKVRDVLGIIVDVNTQNDNGKQYIEIVVEPSSVPINYHGQYHYRSGATKQELKGIALQEFILKKMGKQWDDIGHETATLDAIDPQAIRYLIHKGMAAHRISAESLGNTPAEVLENLHLTDEYGKIKNAALLLFGKCPQHYFTGVQFKIGRFGRDEADLMFQDVVEGNILQMADRVMEVLKSKYLISPIHYEGMQRIEPLEIPEDALREILYNAIIHKQYCGAPIQMRVYNDHIEIWNEGLLPEGYTIATLLGKHSSRPRNLNIAEVFYRAGFVETWGRGFRKIREGFAAANLPMPTFEETCGGIQVTIPRPVHQEEVQNVLQDVSQEVPQGVPQDNSVLRQTILDMIQKDGKVSREDIAQKAHVSVKTIQREIKRMPNIRYVGSGYSGHWEIITSEE